MEINFVTSNKDKFNEVKNILSKFGITVNQVNINIEEIRSEDIKEIAIKKAEFAYEKIKKPVLVEDSGLFVKDLNGFPGPYTNFALKKIGNIGILNLVNGKERNAEAVLTFSYYNGKEKIVIYHVLKGKLAEKEKGHKGHGGFGWDPIFIPENQEKTFGEMKPEEKNSYWRGAALKDFVKEYFKRKD